MRSFFDRYKHRDQVELQEKAAVRDTVIRELEALLPAEGAAAEPAPETSTPSFSRRGAGGSRRPSCRARAAGSGRAVSPGRRAARGDVAGRIRRHRSRSRDDAQADGEAVVAKVEEIVSRSRRSRRDLSPTELLAQQLRERLAANTMSGGGNRAAENEESRWRAAEQEVRSAQAQWMRLGPVPADVAGPLNERFQRACREFFDSRKRDS